MAIRKIIFIENPNQTMDEIERLIEIVYEGFMALSHDYGYHVTNVFGDVTRGKVEIYELRDSINYRIRSANLHFYLLLVRKLEIEERFTEMLRENPTCFNGFVGSNAHFEIAADEIMAIYDSIVFHLSSCFDYLAMLTQHVFGKNPQSKLQWITLVKHCYNPNGEFSGRKFVENIKKVDSEFVSKFNDYRAELIHRKKSTSFTNVSLSIKSGRGKVVTQFECSEKIKSNLKKVINQELNYCVTFASFKLIKETLLDISHVLHGMFDEFRENYNPHSPVIKEGGFQIVSMNPKSKFAESPALMSWEKFMEYKKFLDDSVTASD